MANLTNRLLYKLNSLYAEAGNEWVGKNSFPLTYAHMDYVALCGSIGKAVCLGRTYNDRQPNDMDFVAKSLDDAMAFHNRICKRLSEYSIYFKVTHNSKTDFCLSGCTYHIRIFSPFWLPICIFVVPNAKFWNFNNRFLVQDIDQIIKSQNELGKVRNNLLTVDETFSVDETCIAPFPKIETPLNFLKDSIVKEKIYSCWDNNG